MDLVEEMGFGVDRCEPKAGVRGRRLEQSYCIRAGTLEQRLPGIAARSEEVVDKDSLEWGVRVFNARFVIWHLTPPDWGATAMPLVDHWNCRHNDKSVSQC